MKIKHQNGFSLLELITVIVLIGILSVTVAMRFSRAPFATASFEQELRAALRFAQKFALVSGCDVEVDVNASTDTYALNLRSDATSSLSACIGATGAFSIALNNPASNGAFTNTAPDGVDIGSGINFFYDNQGRPSIAGGSVTINGNTLLIEAETGYVH